MDESELVDALIADSIAHTVKRVGLERTKEMIESVYACHPVTQERMLKVYQKMYFPKKI